MSPQIMNELFLVDRRGNQRLKLLSSRQLLQKVRGIQFGVRHIIIKKINLFYENFYVILYCNCFL
uniref:55kb from the right end sequence n=1 Tax=African swine fever virus TaxID=10497 RepID=Q65222_ASF|nr:unnamed protein product [African swine fever virus]